MGWTVLVTARAFLTSGKWAQKMLEEAGCRILTSPQPGPLPEDELLSSLSGCDAVIASSDPYTARIFEALPSLKLVARCGVGIDSVDLEAATAMGVVVTNTPGAMTEAVADHAFALLLAIARRIPEADTLMRSGDWKGVLGASVYGKTLGIIGFGQIGQAVARRATGFLMRILAYDPPLQALPPPQCPLGAEYTDLENLLMQSDFISLHAPCTPDTVGLIKAAQLSKMKPTAYLINTARGALVDEIALLDALERGQIAGAAIDTYQEEPLPKDHPLRRAPRCVLTPHIASQTPEAAHAMCQDCVQSVLSLLRGEKPPHICNPAVWEAPTRRSRSLAVSH
jgi:D-3-phosphoglycerate dehydrogenase